MTRERGEQGRDVKEQLRTTRTLAPNARGGRFTLNFDLTTPELPCGRVTRLHKTYNQSISTSSADAKAKKKKERKAYGIGERKGLEELAKRQHRAKKKHQRTPK